MTISMSESESEIEVDEKSQSSLVRTTNSITITAANSEPRPTAIETTPVSTLPPSQRVEMDSLSQGASSEDLSNNAETAVQTQAPRADQSRGRGHRVRLRFAKRGDLRFISHHDLMRTLERMIRRADLPMAHSQGFNPRPKATFALAMALGIEGSREILDLELTEALSAETVQDRLQAEAPEGLEFKEALILSPDANQRPVAARYELEIPLDRWDQAKADVEKVLASRQWPFTRRRPDRNIDIQMDLRPFLLDAGWTGASNRTLWFRSTISDSGSVRPEEILSAFGLRDLLVQGAVLVRADLETSLTPRSTQSIHQPDR